MAFVAAFPSFPLGDWPVWDARISMEGNFISQWVEDIGMDLCGPQRAGVIRQAIWEELKELVADFLLIPIVSDFVT